MRMMIRRRKIGVSAHKEAIDLMMRMMMVMILVMMMMTVLMMVLMMMVMTTRGQGEWYLSAYGGDKYAACIIPTSALHTQHTQPQLYKYKI